MSDLKDEIYKACKSGNIDTIKNFIESSNDKVKNDISVLAMIICTIQCDQLETFKFLIDSGFKKEDLYDEFSVNAYLQAICSHSIENKLEFFKYAFSHPKIRKNEDDFMEQSLRFSTINDVLDVFQYLCDNFPKSKALYRGLFSGATLIEASNNGAINILDYIFNNKSLNKYVDIHVQKDHPFKAAYESNQFDVLKYFIFDMNIDITYEIENYIKSKPAILNMFEMREANKELQKELDNKQTTNKKPKI